MGLRMEDQEGAILRAKLTQAEAKLANAEDVIRRQAGAILDVELKTYHSMKQLLIANDVKKNEAMRVNILEIMNELQRFNKQRFEGAGISAYVTEAPQVELERANHSAQRAGH